MSVSTGCTSAEAIAPDEPDAYREVLKGMLPELPAVPSFPELSWSFHDGLYCISESDVDRLLDYSENMMPLLKSELSLYKRQLDIVLNQL